MFQDLLVHVTADQTGESRLRYALAMAASFGARRRLVELDTARIGKPMLKHGIQLWPADREEIKHNP